MSFLHLGNKEAITHDNRHEHVLAYTPALPRVRSVQKTQKITNQYAEIKNLTKHWGFSKMWKIFPRVTKC